MINYRTSASNIMPMTKLSEDIRSSHLTSHKAHTISKVHIKISYFIAVCLLACSLTTYHPFPSFLLHARTSLTQSETKQTKQTKKQTPQQSTMHVWPQEWRREIQFIVHHVVCVCSFCSIYCLLILVWLIDWLHVCWHIEWCENMAFRLLSLPL